MLYLFNVSLTPSSNLPGRIVLEKKSIEHNNNNNNDNNNNNNIDNDDDRFTIIIRFKL